MTDRIVDACCLINLYASNQVQEILTACGGTFYVPKQVQRESLAIRQPEAKDPSVLVMSPIDLGDALLRGLIVRCDLEGAAELRSYVEFAAELDDGEASCLAIAKSRGWIVATDDRKAIRVAAESGIAVITTPELIDRWVRANRPTQSEIADTLRRIERFACFRPRRNSPLHDWWLSVTQVSPQ